MLRYVKNVALFSGSSHPELAEKVAARLGGTVQSSIHDAFSNGERRVELQSPVLRKHVYIFQTGAGNVNDALMELLLMVNAAKLSDPRSITAVIPNYPYARQDKQDRHLTPISAKVVAEMLETAGVTRLITMELHSAQLQGFFSIPVINLSTSDLLVENLEDYVTPETILVAPDVGSSKRTRSIAQKMDLDYILMSKQRDHEQKSYVEETIIVGGDHLIKEKSCVIIDDMADTFGTVTQASKTLIERGAKEVIVAVTHGVLSGPAIDRLNETPDIKWLLTSNSTPQDAAVTLSDKIIVYDVSEIIATQIEKITNGGGC